MKLQWIPMNTKKIFILLLYHYYDSMKGNFNFIFFTSNSETTIQMWRQELRFVTLGLLSYFFKIHICDHYYNLSIFFLSNSCVKRWDSSAIITYPLQGCTCYAITDDYQYTSVGKCFYLSDAFFNF